MNTRVIDLEPVLPWYKAVFVRPYRWALRLIQNADSIGAGILIFLMIGLILAVTIGPFLLHIGYCLAAERAIMLAILVLGLVVPPIGWFHGWVIFLRWLFT